MSLEKITQLASIEILFPSRAINAAWHTYIKEDGEIISGPSINRKAFAGEDISEIMEEVTQFISADYALAISRIAQLEQQYAQGSAESAAKDARIAQLERELARLQSGVA